MLSKSHKAILAMIVLSLSFQAKAQVTEHISSNVISAAQDDVLIEMQTIDGEVFLVKKKDLVKNVDKQEDQKVEIKTTQQAGTAVQTQEVSTSVTSTEATVATPSAPVVVTPTATDTVVPVEATPKKEVISSQEYLNNSPAKNIQIRVDANKYYNDNSVTNTSNTLNNNINLENVTIDNKKLEVNDNVVQKDVVDSTAAKQDTNTTLSNEQLEVKKDADNINTATENNTNTNTATTTTTTGTNAKSDVESKVDVITPVVVDPSAPVIIDPVPPIIIDPVDPTLPPVVVIPVPEKPDHDKDKKKFFVRGGFGLGTFTDISDVNANYSFGVGLGYHINHKFSVELQYTFTEFEDTYTYYGYGYDDVFDQNDFASVLNYTLFHKNKFDLRLRGGLNYAYRTFSDPYYGYENSSDSFSLIFGVGADIKVDKNIFITANADYYYNINDNGYNYELDTLDLVAGKNYFLFNIGVKFKF